MQHFRSFTEYLHLFKRAVSGLDKCFINREAYALRAVCSERDGEFQEIQMKVDRHLSSSLIAIVTTGLDPAVNNAQVEPPPDLRGRCKPPHSTAAFN